MEGYYPATFGFEGDDDRDDREGWLVNKAGGTVQVLPSYYEYKKILELHELIDDFTDISNVFGSRTNGTFECWVMVNRTDYWFSLGVYDSVTSNGIHIGFSNVGIIKYNDDVNWIWIIDYSAHIWYHFSIEWDLTTDWHLWINGVSQDEGTGYSYRNSPPTVDRVRFQISNFGDSRDQYIYVDAVGYSWDPNYNIGDNEDEGLLLSFETGFTPDWVGYSLEGMSNKTILGNNSIPFPDDGIHKIQVFGNDSVGNMYESDLHYFTIDTTAPTSLISFKPHSGTNIVNKSTEFTITANDGTGSGVSIIQYKINDSSWVTYTGSFDLSSYSYAYYLIKYQAIDVVGNIESENTLLVLLVEIPSKEPEILGFNTFLMLSLIGLVTLILIKRYKK